MKCIGIDYGRRRIGLAVTDENGEYIRGLATIDRKSVSDWLNVLCREISSQQPQTIVIGLPLDIDNNDTNMSREVRSFAQDLGLKVPFPIVFVDESLSSIQASEIMRFRKKKDRRNKEAVDRVAACLILETFRKGCVCS